MDDQTNQQNPAGQNNEDPNGLPSFDDQSSNAQTSSTAGTQADLQLLQTQLQEMTKVAQHALADLQNFKRRAEEERSSYVQYANAELIVDLLPALENVSRALAHEPKDAEWAKGVEQTLKQMAQVFEKRNLKTVATVGQKFDPTMHEALMTGPGEKDIVTAEFEKGYMLADRVIKRARVKVGDGSAEEKN